MNIGHPDEKKDESSRFNEDDFKSTLETVRIDTTQRLMELYPGKEIKVIISQQKRDLKKQMEYAQNKKSRTSLGLHNFGAAGDFIIYMDGVKYDGTGGTGKGSLKPYQVLGGAARDAGLFWGWDFDSGHVAETRFVDEFIRKYPQFIEENKDLKEWYLSNFQTTKATYRPIMQLLDEKYGVGNASRQYLGDDRTVEKLLEPIVPAARRSVNDKVFDYIKR